MTARSMGRAAPIALLAFGTLSAAAGGIALLTGTITLPAEWLDDTVFASYTVPGLILALVVGGSQVVALYATLRHQDWAVVAAGVAGSVLMGWIIGEGILVGTRSSFMLTLQVLYFFNGLLEAACAVAESWARKQAV